MKNLPGWLETLYNLNPSYAEKAERWIDENCEVYENSECCGATITSSGLCSQCKEHV